MLLDSIYARNVLNMLGETSQGRNIQISKMIDPKKSDELFSLKDKNHYMAGFDGINALNTYLKAGAAVFTQVRAMHF